MCQTSSTRPALTRLLELAAVLFFTCTLSFAQKPVDHCGQTLDTPGVYVLATDLDCSKTFASGINIAATGVTLHLGNHTLSSTDCDLNRGIYGIFVPGNVSNVKIDGGTVRGFDDGVVLSSSHSRVSAMTVTGACQFGIAVQNDGNTVTTSRVTRNSVDGIGLQVASNTQITSNDISDNLGNGVGVSNLPGFTHNLISHNILSRNAAGSGVRISGGSDITVADNAFDSNLDGIVLEDAGNSVHGNTIRGSLGVGIYVPPSASPSTITGNTVLGSAASDMSDVSPACGGNTWKANFFDTDLVNSVPDGGPKKGCLR